MNVPTRSFTAYRRCLATAGLATVSLVATFLAMPTRALAQEPRYDVAAPEHALLERFAGDWNFERFSVPTDGSEPRSLGSGTVRAEMIGDFFVHLRWSGRLYGVEYEAFQSLGYDVAQGAYTGSWVDGFMSFRWELTGALDEGTGVFTLVTRGPAPTGGTAAFRERYTFESDGSVTILGEMEQGAGWVGISSTRLTPVR